MAIAGKTFEQRVKEARTKAEMTEWVERVYKATEREIQPMPPFIFIRTLPRSTISSGGIYMPDKQNKPNIEAVVLKVYEPYWEVVESRTREDGKTEDISVWNECDVEVGDHIILPHHVGLPDSFLDAKEYRLIREDDAIARLHYWEKGTLREMVLETVRGSIMKPRSLGHSTDSAGTMFGQAVDAILENFDIIPKEMASKTLSGV